MAAYIWPHRPDGANKWMGVDFMRGGLCSVGSRLVAIECLWVRDGAALVALRHRFGGVGIRGSVDLNPWSGS